MQLPKEEKVEAVQEIRKSIEGSSSLLLTDYRGLTVSEITTLRRTLHDAGADYKVVKNTLFKLAADKLAESGIYDLLAGPTAVAFVHNDPIAPAKAIVDFAREHKELEVKGGYVEGRLLTADQIQTLSRIPPKEVLLAQLVGSIQSPISGFVGTLQGLLSNLVYTLQAVADQKTA
jgi:large subunit ribosomal protein L10